MPPSSQGYGGWAIAERDKRRLSESPGAAATARCGRRQPSFRCRPASPRTSAPRRLARQRQKTISSFETNAAADVMFRPQRPHHRLWGLGVDGGPFRRGLGVSRSRRAFTDQPRRFQGLRQALGGFRRHGHCFRGPGLLGPLSLCPRLSRRAAINQARVRARWRRSGRGLLRRRQRSSCCATAPSARARPVKPQFPLGQIMKHRVVPWNSLDVARST